MDGEGGLPGRHLKPKDSNHKHRAASLAEPKHWLGLARCPNGIGDQPWSQVITRYPRG